jgi:hypothetical protein
LEEGKPVDELFVEWDGSPPYGGKYALSLWLLSCLLRESLVEMDEMLAPGDPTTGVGPETALLTFRKSLERTLSLSGSAGGPSKLKVVSVETSSYSKRECFDLGIQRVPQFNYKAD